MQIYLRDDQIEALKAVAERQGESMAALVRQGVDMLLQALPPTEDTLFEIVGLFDSSLGDLAENHDEYLIKFISDENQDAS